MVKDLKHVESVIEKSIRINPADYEKLLQEKEEQNEKEEEMNEWTVSIQKELRNERNKRNFFRVLIIFSIQIMLLVFMVFNLD